MSAAVQSLDTTKPKEPGINEPVVAKSKVKKTKDKLSSHVVRKVFQSKNEYEEAVLKAINHWKESKSNTQPISNTNLNNHNIQQLGSLIVSFLPESTQKMIKVSRRMKIPPFALIDDVLLGAKAKVKYTLFESLGFRALLRQLNLEETFQLFLRHYDNRLDFTKQRIMDSRSTFPIDSTLNGFEDIKNFEKENPSPTEKHQGTQPDSGLATSDSSESSDHKNAQRIEMFQSMVSDLSPFLNSIDQVQSLWNAFKSVENVIPALNCFTCFIRSLQSTVKNTSEQRGECECHLCVQSNQSSVVPGPAVEEDVMAADSENIETRNVNAANCGNLLSSKSEQNIETNVKTSAVSQKKRKRRSENITETQKPFIGTRFSKALNEGRPLTRQKLFSVQSIRKVYC